MLCQYALLSIFFLIIIGLVYNSYWYKTIREKYFVKVDSTIKGIFSDSTLNLFAAYNIIVDYSNCKTTNCHKINDSVSQCNVDCKFPFILNDEGYGRLYTGHKQIVFFNKGQDTIVFATNDLKGTGRFKL